MSRNHTRFSGSFLAAGALLLAACAEPTSAPVNIPTSPGIYDLVVSPTLDGIPEGTLQVCKVAVGGGAGTNFSFTVTREGVEVAGSPFTIAAGACANVGTETIANGDNAATWVVTEGADPSAEWDLTAISATRYQAAVGDPANTGSDNVDLGNRQATVAFNNDLAARVTFTNTFTPPTGNEGCTPGYWKQDQHFDSWNALYDPTDSFNATFGIGTNWFPNSFTLLDALKAGGGGENALARHAVAALLNSAEGFYPMSTAEVIAAVQAAYADEDLVEDTKDDFADNNELGCPLN